MEIENYVMENFIKRVIKTDRKGRQYVDEEDLRKLNLNYNEKKFIEDILKKHHINYLKKLSADGTTSPSLERAIKRYYDDQMKSNPEFRRAMKGISCEQFVKSRGQYIGNSPRDKNRCKH